MELGGSSSRRGALADIVRGQGAVAGASGPAGSDQLPSVTVPTTELGNQVQEVEACHSLSSWSRPAPLQETRGRTGATRVLCGWRWCCRWTGLPFLMALPLRDFSLPF